MNASLRKRRLLKLAEYLETRVSRREFHMATFLSCDNEENFDGYRHIANDLFAHRCGAIGCIAGHAVALFRRQIDWKKVPGLSIMDRAAELLGLTYEESNSRATGVFYDYSISTPKQAAKRLRKLAEASGDDPR